MSLGGVVMMVAISLYTLLGFEGVTFDEGSVMTGFSLMGTVSLSSDLVSGLMNVDGLSAVP